MTLALKEERVVTLTLLSESIGRRLSQTVGRAVFSVSEASHQADEKAERRERMEYFYS